MLLCKEYKKCKENDCEHKTPHSYEDRNCWKCKCWVRQDGDFYCEEELYVYMREAIDEEIHY